MFVKTGSAVQDKNPVKLGPDPQPMGVVYEPKVYPLGRHHPLSRQSVTLSDLDSC